MFEKMYGLNPSGGNNEVLESGHQVDFSARFAFDGVLDVYASGQKTQSASGAADLTPLFRGYRG